MERARYQRIMFHIKQWITNLAYEAFGFSTKSNNPHYDFFYMKLALSRGFNPCWNTLKNNIKQLLNFMALCKVAK